MARMSTSVNEITLKCPKALLSRDKCILMNFTSSEVGLAAAQVENGRARDCGGCPGHHQRANRGTD